MIANDKVRIKINQQKIKRNLDENFITRLFLFALGLSRTLSEPTFHASRGLKRRLYLYGWQVWITTLALIKGYRIKMRGRFIKGILRGDKAAYNLSTPTNTVEDSSYPKAPEPQELADLKLKLFLS